MASDLALLGSYARRMAVADHADGCTSLTRPLRPRWRLTDDLEHLTLDGFTPSPPLCDGCVTAGERELWAQIADEIDDHLQRGDHHPAEGLF